MPLALPDGVHRRVLVDPEFKACLREPTMNEALDTTPCCGCRINAEGISTCSSDRAVTCSRSANDLPRREGFAVSIGETFKRIPRRVIEFFDPVKEAPRTLMRFSERISDPADWLVASAHFGVSPQEVRFSVVDGQNLISWNDLARRIEPSRRRSVSQLANFSDESGGGGGNRTRVRMVSGQRVYVRSFRPLSVGPVAETWRSSPLDRHGSRPRLRPVSGRGPAL
jgi:hypothetical protein